MENLSIQELSQICGGGAPIEIMVEGAPVEIMVELSYSEGCRSKSQK